VEKKKFSLQFPRRKFGKLPISVYPAEMYFILNAFHNIAVCYCPLHVCNYLLEVTCKPVTDRQFSSLLHRPLLRLSWSRRISTKCYKFDFSMVSNEAVYTGDSPSSSHLSVMICCLSVYSSLGVLCTEEILSHKLLQQASGIFTDCGARRKNTKLKAVIR
jgi:hypothetical protein